MYRKPTALRLLVLGTGRNGSTSITALIREIIKLNHAPFTVRHETQVQLLYEACSQYLTKDNKNPLANILLNWQHAIEVGSGFSFFMPILQELFGAELKVIYLKRNRERCIQSLVQHAILFPHSFSHYTQHPIKTIRRPTAVDFKEMLINEWKDLPLFDKMAWYYDKTHLLTEQHLSLFQHHLSLDIEALNQTDSIQTLTHFINPEYSHYPFPIHLNLSNFFDSSRLTKTSLNQVNHLTYGLNLQQLLRSDFYPMEFFVIRLIREFKENPLDLRLNLIIVLELLEKYLNQIPLKTSQFAPLIHELLTVQKKQRILNIEQIQRYPYLEPVSIKRLEDIFEGLELDKLLRYPIYPVLFFLNKIIAISANGKYKSEFYILKRTIETTLAQHPE